MNAATEFLIRAVLLGVGATLLIDLWAVLLRRLFAVPSLNWAMVGRWIGHFPRGQFVHDSIAKASPVSGELALGWLAHYAIGIGFAAVLLALNGLAWGRAPTLLPALAVGIGTVIAPFFILQPGMGLGIAASKTPKPAVARLRSLATHGLFGIGLYVTAQLLNAVW